MEKTKKYLSPDRKIFNEKYKDLTESEIQKELLFTQRLSIEKLERIRTNTSTLVWFLIVIPIIAVVFMAMFSSLFNRELIIFF